MALSGMEIAQMAAEFKSRQSAPKAPVAKSADRIKIVSGSKKIGDTINGHTITGFGKSWVQFIADCDTSAWGLAPGKDYRVEVQYAYCN